jgi:predicted RNA-binding protein YlqC (UPF0109 family)
MSEPKYLIVFPDCLVAPDCKTVGKPAIKALLAEIAKALVDHPGGVQVRAVGGSHVTVLELKTHPEDLGRVIRRQERTAETMRTLFGAAGVKLQAIHT